MRARTAVSASLPGLLVVAMARAAAAAENPSPLPVGSVAGAPAPQLEAVGLVRSAVATRSVAILRGEGRTRVVAVGETAFGARLLSVGTDTVRLEIGGRPLELKLTQAAVAATPSAAAAALADAASSRRGGPPEDPATPAREMDKRQVQIRLGEEMNRILTDTALAPVMEDGRVAGVQITRIAEGSLLTDAGLRAGDVLTSVNDTQIDGMASLIALWPRLQGASELRATVTRGGQPFSLRVTLR